MKLLAALFLVLGIGAASAQQSPNLPQGYGFPDQCVTTSQSVVTTFQYLQCQPQNVATGQVSVATTATLISAARNGRSAVTVENLGTTAVYLGPAGVTSATGILLPGTAGASITIPGGAAVYGAVVTGTQSVAFMETY